MYIMIRVQWTCTERINDKSINYTFGAAPKNNTHNTESIITALIVCHYYRPKAAIPTK